MEEVTGYVASKGYRPVVRAMADAACSAAGARRSAHLVSSLFPRRRARLAADLESSIVGEVFFGETCLYLLWPAADNLHCFAAGVGDCRPEVEQFCAFVEEGARARLDGRRVRGMDFTWHELPMPGVRAGIRRYPDLFEAVEMEVAEPDYSEAEADAARLLVDPDARRSILRLAQVGKARSKEALELAPQQLVGDLLGRGLILEEFLLTCKQDQHTICGVSSRDAVEAGPGDSLVCNVCGRSFNDENLQLIYALTDAGKKLLDGSRWMSVWVTELLKASGVKPDAIKWSLQAAGEELDIMAEAFNSRVFFELKDRQFGLGDAYPFVYRVTRYGGWMGVVATADKVSSDAKQFFDEEARNPVRSFGQIVCLEGVPEIEAGISRTVRDLAFLEVQRALTPLSERTGIDLWPIVRQWLTALKP